MDTGGGWYNQEPGNPTLRCFVRLACHPPVSVWEKFGKKVSMADVAPQHGQTNSRAKTKQQKSEMCDSKRRFTHLFSDAIHLSKCCTLHTHPEKFLRPHLRHIP